MMDIVGNNRKYGVLRHRRQEEWSVLKKRRQIRYVHLSFFQSIAITFRLNLSCQPMKKLTLYVTHFWFFLLNVLNLEVFLPRLRKWRLTGIKCQPCLPAIVDHAWHVPMFDWTEFYESSLSTSIITGCRRFRVPKDPRKLVLSTTIERKKFFPQKREQRLMADVDRPLTFRARIRRHELAEEIAMSVTDLV
jgi:hypothetical protein